MGRLLSIATLSACLAATSLYAAPTVATAQTASSQAASSQDALSQRMLAINVEMERLTAASAVLASPEFQAANKADDPQAFLASIEPLMPKIAQARLGIQKSIDGLRALPALDQGQENAELVNRVTADALSSAVAIDELLLQVEGLPQAIRANDMDALAEASVALVSGGILMIENQAVMLESRLPMIPATMSEYQSVSISAHMYWAMGLLTRGGVGIASPEDVASGLQDLAEAIERDIAAGRANLAMETAQIPLYIAHQRPGIRRIGEFQAQTFAVADEVLAQINLGIGIATSDAREEAVAERMMDAILPFVDFELRQQALVQAKMVESAALMAGEGL